MSQTRLITCTVLAEVPAEMSINEWRDYVADAVGTVKVSRHPHTDPLFDLDSKTVRVKYARAVRGKKLPARQYDFGKDDM